MQIDPRVIDLYNEFIHSTLPRRDFMARLVKIVGTPAAAAAVLPLIECNYARAGQVEEKDKRLQTQRVAFKSADGNDVHAYVARLKGKGKLPAVVVIHENRGLNPHIEDVARRAALAGYLAIAPDGLSSIGGTPQSPEDAGRDAFAKTDAKRIAADVMATVPYALSHPESTGKVGTVGFCYGGSMSLRCAAETPGLTAAVGFYGRIAVEDVPKIKIPIMMNYAGDDKNINAGIPDFRAALDANQISYSINMYPGTGHGFHNDTSDARYNAEAAKLAWARTVAFFDHYLKKGA
jgi:carboxymethylenebutenolidase